MKKCSKLIIITLLSIAIIVAFVPATAMQTVYASSKPSKVVISSAKANNTTAITVKWKKVTGAKGYQIRYSLKSSMAGAKKKTTTAKRKKLKNLKAGKKYYIQVRAYKKKGSKKKYGKWSSKRKVITDYSIKYVLNGGTQATGQRTHYSKTTQTFSLKVPMRVGYVFGGWYTTSDYKTKVTSIKKGTVGNKVFYAKWSVKQGTKDNPIDPTKTFALTDYSGSINARLVNTYVGEEALGKLEEMGEERWRFTFNDSPDYKTILLEYTVSVKNGKFYGDLLGGGMYEPNKTSKMDYLCYELMKNADKDLFGGDIDMSAGQTGTFFCVYGIPVEFTEYYEKISTTDEYVWFHYVIE